MARKIRSYQLETRTQRLKLAVRRKPYTVRVAPGIRLGYRRNATSGTWSVLGADGQGGSWLRRLALADDHEDSDAKNVLTYDEAAEAARKLARAGPGEEAGDRPATVSEAIESYRLDLIARDAQPANADRILVHIPPAISQRPVAMLTAKEVRAWRNGLVDKGLTRASANRYMKSLAACLTLAAKLDSRIANSAAWKVSALPDATEARNVILSDVQVRTVVEASYKINIAFGTLAEVLAVLGVRPSQAKRLRVGDLNADHPDGPQLEMPCSKKGSGVKRIARVPLPIPQVLARRVAAAAVGRPDSDPLLLDPAGNEWTSGGHVEPFEQAAAAAGLPEGTTIYSLRHSSIVRSLLLGTPTRLVAASHDTSVSQIEAHYSKYITTPGAALMRRAAEALNLDVGPPDSNVVPMARAKQAAP
jgi:integrase